MGNAIGKNETNTWAFSKRVSMNHDRLHELRNACFEATGDHTAPITRLQLRQCLEKLCISYSPDGEIILSLYAMWDVMNVDQVEQVPFLLGLCPLACEQDETVRSFLWFALSFLDDKKTGFINEKQLFLVLDCLNTTVSHLGDSALPKSRIHEMVNEVVASISLIDEEGKKRILSINDVASVLSFDPRIQSILSQEDKTSRRASHVSLEKFEDHGDPSDNLTSDSSFEDLLALRSPSANSEETWGAEHPGFPRFSQAEKDATWNDPSKGHIQEDANCMMISLGVVCLPMLLVL